MRLSSMSWTISSALRKREKGRKRRAQQRASTQADFTSEPAEFWATQTHAFIFVGRQRLRMITHKHNQTQAKYPLISNMLSGSLILPAGNGELVSDMKHPA